MSPAGFPNVALAVGIPTLTCFFPIRHCPCRLDMSLSHVRNSWLILGLFPPLGLVGPLRRWSSGLSSFAPWGGNIESKKAPEITLKVQLWAHVLHIWCCGELWSVIKISKMPKNVWFHCENDLFSHLVLVVAVVIVVSNLAYANQLASHVSYHQVSSSWY